MLQLLLILFLVLLALWNLAAGLIVAGLLVALLVWATTTSPTSDLERRIRAIQRANRRRGSKK